MRRLGFSADLPNMGDRVNEFQVLRAVGRGGVATVYIVTNEQDAQRRRCALKLLHPELAVRPESHAMLYDEMRVLAQIRHPNVIRFISRGTWRGIPYIALEAVDGRTYCSILNMIRSHRRVVPPGFHYAILSKVAAGLHGAHCAADTQGQSLQIVHRDVKPSNVLIGHDGCVKVIDFSAMRARKRHTRTQAGKVKGTPAYLSPEQIARPAQVDHRTDVWALGVMAWEALSGQRLFRSRSFGEAVWQIMRADIQHLSDVAPAVPEEMASIVMACLERDQDLRPSSTAVLGDMFAEAAARTGWSEDAAVGAELQRMLDISQSIPLRRLEADAGPGDVTDDATTGLHVPVDLDWALAQ